MNALDAVLVLLGVLAAGGGFRLGLMARALSWTGMVIGLLLATRAVPWLVGRIDRAEPTGRLVVAAGVLLGGAFAGQAVGLVVGARAHLALPRAGQPLDRVGGAAAGVSGLVAAVWLLLPTMADVPGAPSRLARGSAITQAVDALAPQPPDTLQTLRRLVGENRFPQVFEALRPAPQVGPPPSVTGLVREAVALTAASTVKVEGSACGRLQEGSGFVPEAGLVVTNAHVVAGHGSTHVVRPDGTRAAAVVVAFDPDRDLALLAVPDVGAGPLRRGQIAPGGTGAVFGHPGGGALEVSPFALQERLEAVGRDLYGERHTRRKVLVLAADLAPGDSGAAVVDRDGGVVGVAFAIAPDQAGTAYALDLEELDAILRAPRQARTGTGPCLS